MKQFRHSSCHLKIARFLATNRELENFFFSGYNGKIRMMGVETDGTVLNNHNTKRKGTTFQGGSGAAIPQNHMILMKSKLI
jgi:hypothetical protein